MQLSTFIQSTFNTSHSALRELHYIVYLQILYPLHSPSTFLPADKVWSGEFVSIFWLTPSPKRQYEARTTSGHQKSSSLCNMGLEQEGVDFSMVSRPNFPHEEGGWECWHRVILLEHFTLSQSPPQAVHDPALQDSSHFWPDCAQGSSSRLESHSSN